MSSKPVPAAAACCCPLPADIHCLCCRPPPVAVAVAARVLIEQLTVSDHQMILLKLCMSVCGRVFGYGSES